MNELSKEMLESAQALSKVKDADVFLFSSPIFRGASASLIKLIDGVRAKKPNAILFLCTLGGDPDAAFQIARSLKRNYKALSVVVFGRPDCD